jgi:hypothetical protein
MNERIENLLYQSGLTAQGCWDELGTYEQDAIKKFAELMTNEFIGILQSEITAVEQYKSTSFTIRDAEWHEGKINHFHKLIRKTNKHFGVE